MAKQSYNFEYPNISNKIACSRFSVSRDEEKKNGRDGKKASERKKKPFFLGPDHQLRPWNKLQIRWLFIKKAKTRWTFPRSNANPYRFMKVKWKNPLNFNQVCPDMNEGVVSKETVVLRRWGSSIQKFGFINGVDNVNWPPYRDSEIWIRSDEGLTLETSAFRISVRWPIYIINSVDKTKFLSRYARARNFC